MGTTLCTARRRRSTRRRLLGAKLSSLQSPAPCPRPTRSTVAASHNANPPRRASERLYDHFLLFLAYCGLFFRPTPSINSKSALLHEAPAPACFSNAHCPHEASVPAFFSRCVPLTST